MTELATSCHASGAAGGPAATGTPHPLDPLTADEFRAAAAILRRDRDVDERWRFASIELREPAKDVVRAFAPGDPIRREARVTVWSRDEGTPYKAVVSLTDDAVVSWEAVPGEQANMTLDEWHEAHEVLIQHPAVVEALTKRGITDLDLVLIDTWAYGHSLIPQGLQDRRVGWTDVWRRSVHGGNPYANPVMGLHFVVDLNTMELLQVEDNPPPAQAPVMGEYVPSLVPGLQPRTDVKPLEITQPEGVSFALDGHELRWQNWTMRLGFNHREGLVIHRVAYDGRPIAHRMSFAEMVVPYRDPSPDHHRRTAFDVGEWGLGFMTTSLKLGCDCLGEITYVDAVLHDTRGEPYTIENAICLHEEDDGVLWKHVDEQAGAEVRRSRRMVVSFHATVANYEYLTYWRFYQDGTIQCEVRATGIMVTSAYEGTPPAYGTVVDERTYAPIHQHFVVARLDMEVDGPENTVVVTESEALPVSDDNPYGLAVVTRSRAVETEAEGRLDVDFATQRSFKVVNRTKPNRLGTAPGYKLYPNSALPAIAHADAPFRLRAQVIDHPVWVSRFDEEERWPSGEFCNQSRRDAGLPEWTKADRPVADTDLVLWHVFGIHHVPRPEDWPVMPVDVVSFELKPVGFFDRNPALDVPPAPDRCH
ncbi:primary-amine oxidase [Geodermatophilus poikilotrophus]|uniref:Amine oxidase n=1 Tax=Geodermatophilus poikilotrophus TaxID=1333667 RepID=A0A1I0BVJ9_9ACTN|nr:primary-amine oxidase [Geodermatophilus poikilotrophus]SET10659.1 primary-amine oxidase [Geodermatophilus poikilotrophus]